MAKYRDLANANVSGEGRAEELGALIDALLPVLVDRLAETGLGEIEVERNGATVRVRSESLGVQQAAAARALRITATEQVALGVVDGIIPEPETLSAEATVTLARALWETASAAFDELESMKDLNELLTARYARYRAFGAFDEAPVKKKGITGAIRSLFGLDRDLVGAGVGDDWIDEIERDSAGA